MANKESNGWWGVVVEPPVGSAYDLYKKEQQWRTARLVIERRLREQNIKATPDELKKWIADEHAELFGKPSWWRRLLAWFKK